MIAIHNQRTFLLSLKWLSRIVFGLLIESLIEKLLYYDILGAIPPPGSIIPIADVFIPVW
jgi:hypothetical protein